MTVTFLCFDADVIKSGKQLLNDALAALVSTPVSIEQCGLFVNIVAEYLVRLPRRVKPNGFVNTRK